MSLIQVFLLCLCVEGALSGWAATISPTTLQPLTRSPITTLPITCTVTVGTTAPTQMMSVSLMMTTQPQADPTEIGIVKWASASGTYTIPMDPPTRTATNISVTTDTSASKVVVFTMSSLNVPDTGSYYCRVLYSTSYLSTQSSNLAATIQGSPVKIPSLSDLGAVSVTPTGSIASKCTCSALPAPTFTWNVRTSLAGPTTPLPTSASNPTSSAPNTLLDTTIQVTSTYTFTPSGSTSTPGLYFISATCASVGSTPVEICTRNVTVTATPTTPTPGQDVSSAYALQPVAAIALLGLFVQLLF